MTPKQPDVVGVSLSQYHVGPSLKILTPLVPYGHLINVSQFRERRGGGGIGPSIVLNGFKGRIRKFQSKVHISGPKVSRVNPTNYNGLYEVHVLSLLGH